ncbi:MAG: hypothetical protein GY785_15240 [Gammaproteobacteria bacterium]|nr:hypothetical protein [Gammaproteobacteria bacterium]
MYTRGDLSLDFPGTPGQHNAITDVPGVKVGYSTVTDAARNIRSGVTAIIPRLDADTPRLVWAGQHTLNGNGEMTGTHWINDAGNLKSPVCITNTHSVGMVHHGVIQWMLRQYANFYSKEHAWIMPVVAETYDGVLNDINAQHISSEHALQALNSAASGAIEEGSVGGGHGGIGGGSRYQCAGGGQRYTHVQIRRPAMLRHRPCATGRCSASLCPLEIRGELSF